MTLGEASMYLKRVSHGFPGSILNRFHCKSVPGFPPWSCSRSNMTLPMVQGKPEPQVIMRTLQSRDSGVAQKDWASNLSQVVKLVELTVPHPAANPSPWPYSRFPIVSLSLSLSAVAVSLVGSFKFAARVSRRAAASAWQPPSPPAESAAPPSVQKEAFRYGIWRYQSYSVYMYRERERDCLYRGICCTALRTYMWYVSIHNSKTMGKCPTQMSNLYSWMKAQSILKSSPLLTRSNKQKYGSAWCDPLDNMQPSQSCPRRAPRGPSLDRMGSCPGN